MKKLFMLLAVVISSTALFSCKQEGPKFGTIKEGVLTVATSPDYAPYEFIDLTKEGQNRYVGADIDLAKFIAKELGLKLEIKPMEFDIALNSVSSGIADLCISGVSYSSDRASTALFSKCYYGDGDGGQVVVIKKSDQNKFKTLADLNKSEVKIASQNGSVQAELVEGQLPNATNMAVTDLPQTYTLLKNGTYDAIAISKNVADTWMSTDDSIVICDSFTYEDSGSYVLGNFNNEDLMNKVNEIIDNVTTNKLFDNWITAAQNLYASLLEDGNVGELEPTE